MATRQRGKAGFGDFWNFDCFFAFHLQVFPGRGENEPRALRFYLSDYAIN